MIAWWQLLLIANSATAYLGYFAATRKGGSNGAGAQGGRALQIAALAAAWLACLGTTFAAYGLRDTLVATGVSLALGVITYGAVRLGTQTPGR